MKKEVFYLVVLTLFAFLTLVQYFSYRDLKTKNEVLNKTLKAYEFYIFSDYDKFEEYVKKESLRIPNIDLLKERKAQSLFVEGQELFKMANYGEALARFREVLKISSDQRTRELVKHYIEKCEEKIGGR